MSDSLPPHGLNHTRLICPPLSPRVCSNSCPLSQWCHPTFSSCPQSFPASGFFSSETALCIMWPKYWTFSFNINPSNEYLGLISFRINRFDLLAVQGTQQSSPTLIFILYLFIYYDYLYSLLVLRAFHIFHIHGY